MAGYTPIKSSIRDALQGQTLDGFNPSQFEAQGGMIYYSLDSAPNQIDVCSLVDTFRSIHLPSLGQFIPQSGEFVSATVADTPAKLVGPTNNEVYRIDNISATNGTLGSITAVVALTDSVSEPSSTVTLASQAIAGGATTVITLANPIYVDKNAVLAVSASGASLAYTAFVYKVVQ
jgi:hypothetical protein